MVDKKGVSVNEFKNWLSGVLDFQPDGWTPNSEQWKKILDKVGQLQETLINPETVPTPQVPVPKKRPVGPVIDESPNIRRAEDFGMTEKVKLPDLPERAKHVTVEKTGSPSIVGEGNQRVISTGEIHKMSTIDTTDGTYQSTFI